MRPPTPILVETAAISVATILGTGILGLPVALHASGILPFLIMFSVNFCTQLGIVTAMTQLLQSAYVTNRSTNLDQTNENKQLMHQHMPHSTTDIVQINQQNESPSLHSLATHFISVPLIRNLFNFLVLLHFLFILSAYALAAPQAYRSLFPFFQSFPLSLFTILFVVISACLVIFIRNTLLHVLTGATLLKAVLLTLLVVVTLVRGLSIRQPITNSWQFSALIDPFLMGTIALSGVANLMPVTFQSCVTGTMKIAPTDNVVDRAFINAYRNTTYLAILFCFLVNIAWSVAVLLVVPQDESTLAASQQANRFINVIRSASRATLTSANEMGQISTVPLIQVLQSRTDSVDTFIALLVNTFIAISITISFLVMSIGLLHYTDSQAKSFAERTNHNYNFYRFLLSIGSFSIVLAVAVLNPSGFIKIMEGLTTLFLNLEAGLFVIYMLFTTRHSNTQGRLPAPLSQKYILALITFVGSYFVIAVFVDIVFYLPHSLAG